MFNVPVTFYAECNLNSEELRRAELAEFAAAGAKHLVLNTGIISAVMQKHSVATALKRELQDAGLDFVDAHSPFGGMLDLNCPDKSFRPQMLLRHKLALYIAAEMGVNTITIHPGSDRFFPEIPLDQHLDLMRASLDELIPEAEKCGVIICIENSMSRAACPRMVTALKAEYASSYLGLCYDSGHAHQLDAGRFTPGGTIWKYWQMVGVDEPEWDDQALERMLPEIVVCHLHDNDGSDDSHNIPGRGTLDWKKVIGLLKSAPRLLAIQSEAMLHDGDTPAALCSKFAELGEL